MADGDSKSEAGDTALELQPSASPTEFFREAIVEVSGHQGFETTQASEHYLVSLLAEQASTGDTMARVEEPFGVRLARAMDSTGGERFERLRCLGDDVLFMSGFFTEHLQTRGLPQDYVSGVGQVAYGGAASMLRRYAASTPPVFDELSCKFDMFVNLLRHISDSLAASAVRNELSVLELYERWARTGSSALAESLMQLGISPMRGDDSTN